MFLDGVEIDALDGNIAHDLVPSAVSDVAEFVIGSGKHDSLDSFGFDMPLYSFRLDNRVWTDAEILADYDLR